MCMWVGVCVCVFVCMYVGGCVRNRECVCIPVNGCVWVRSNVCMSERERERERGRESERKRERRASFFQLSLKIKVFGSFSRNIFLTFKPTWMKETGIKMAFALIRPPPFFFLLSKFNFEKEEKLFSHF